MEIAGKHQDQSFCKYPEKTYYYTHNVYQQYWVYLSTISLYRSHFGKKSQQSGSPILPAMPNTIFIYKTPLAHTFTYK